MRILPRVTSADRDQPREVALAIVLGLIGVSVMVIAGLAMLGGAGTAYDLSAYLGAAERITAGGTPYQPETLGGPFQPGPAGLYLYAPPLAAAMVPLAALPEATVTVGCDSGPVVTVAGRSYRTSVTTTVAALASGEEIPATLCDTGTVALPAGRVHLDISPGAAFVATIPLRAMLSPS